MKMFIWIVVIFTVLTIGTMGGLAPTLAMFHSLQRAMTF